MTDLSLKIAGTKYKGWTRAQVTRSLEELAHSYVIDFTDTWTEGKQRIPIEAGLACEIDLIDQGVEKVITGYVDKDKLSYTSDSRTLNFAGRSKTGDLIDCAAIYKGGQWLNKGLLTIAKNICTPFGIGATTNVSLGGPFEKFSIQEGETAFQCIQRGARQRGVLMLTDGNGDLFFDRVSTTLLSTKLEYGVNILSCDREVSWDDRFSVYTVKTQASGGGSIGDTLFGDAAASLKRRSTDEGVDRYRPTIIMAENEEKAVELQKRANWERNIRAGRSKTLSYVTPGWSHNEGLWEPNRLVRVVDPVAHVDDTLLIVSVTQSKDQNGSKTVLGLAVPEAYDVQPLPPSREKELSFW